MMPPIADDIAASYLPHPLPPPTSVELHQHQHHHLQQQRKWKPSASSEAAPNCPRCDSPNTKFCYYNNYSLAQPRYFCKGCRRYWTKGGSLRNVPVGGGCRKNRRGRSSSTRLNQDARGRGADQTPSTAKHRHGASSGCGENSSGMLEDIAGSGVVAAAASSTTSSSGGTSRASDGSDIDLAVLYAKYLSDQSSEHESSPDCQQKLGTLELPGDAAAAVAAAGLPGTPGGCSSGCVVVDVEPTFEFDYAVALGQQIPAEDPAACGFATTSGLPTSEAAQLPDLGFDSQFQYLLPESTDSLSSGMDDTFWANSLPVGSSIGNSMWQQHQCPGDQFILPMLPDQQQDPLVMMGPLAHHQSLLLGGGAWPALDSWSIDAVTRL